MPNEGKNILATYGGTLVLQGAALENFGDWIPHMFLERARNHSKPLQQFPKLCLTAWVSPFQANVSTQSAEWETGAPARGTGGLGWNTDAASQAKTPTPAPLPSAPLRAAFLPPSREDRAVAGTPASCSSPAAWRQLRRMLGHCL